LTPSGNCVLRNRPTFIRRLAFAGLRVLAADFWMLDVVRPRDTADEAT
jgi:hypothetical protein